MQVLISYFLMHLSCLYLFSIFRYFHWRIKRKQDFFCSKTESPWLLSSLIQCCCLFQADFFLDLCVIMWRASHPALKGIICSSPEVSYGSASGPERQLNLIAANRFPLATWTDPTDFPFSVFTAGVLKGQKSCFNRQEFFSVDRNT